MTYSFWALALLPVVINVKLFKHSSKDCVRTNFFVEHIINHWNRLPEIVNFAVFVFLYISLNVLNLLVLCTNFIVLFWCRPLLVHSSALLSSSVVILLSCVLVLWTNKQRSASKKIRRLGRLWTELLLTDYRRNKYQMLTDFSCVFVTIALQCKIALPVIIRVSSETDMPC